MSAAEVAFGSARLEDDDWERERKALPASRALAAFDGGKPVALAGAYRVRPLDPGRRAALRRRHLGRRPADAPAPRDPARLDAAAARRTCTAGASRSRRSGRPRRRSTGASATGTAAPSLARQVRHRAASRSGRAGRAARFGWSTPTRRSALPPVYERVRAGRAGMLVARTSVVEGASAGRPRELAARREPEVLRRRRGRRGGRGLRATTAIKDEWEDGLRAGRGARGRGARDVAARPSRRSGASCTGST